MRYLFVIASLIFSGCVSAGTQYPTQAEYHGRPASLYLLTDDQKAEVESGTRFVLKDPQSAQFRSISAYQTDKGEIGVCGFVNARNSFGGYVGERPFVGVLSDARFEPLIASTDSLSQTVRQFCRANGALMGD